LKKYEKENEEMEKKRRKIFPFLIFLLPFGRRIFILPQAST